MVLIHAFCPSDITLQSELKLQEDGKKNWIGFISRRAPWQKTNHSRFIQRVQSLCKSTFNKTETSLHQDAARGSSNFLRFGFNCEKLKNAYPSFPQVQIPNKDIFLFMQPEQKRNFSRDFISMSLCPPLSAGFRLDGCAVVRNPAELRSQ